MNCHIVWQIVVVKPFFKLDQESIDKLCKVFISLESGCKDGSNDINCFYQLPKYLCSQDPFLKIPLWRGP